MDFMVPVASFSSTLTPTENATHAMPTAPRGKSDDGFNSHNQDDFTNCVDNAPEMSLSFAHLLPLGEYEEERIY